MIPLTDRIRLAGIGLATGRNQPDVPLRYFGAQIRWEPCRFDSGTAYNLQFRLN